MIFVCAERQRRHRFVVAGVPAERPQTCAIGNESVPKIIINDTIFFFLKLQSAFGNFKPYHFSECCLIIFLPYILFEKCINILALGMACPGNRHCASCISTLSFPIVFTYGAAAVAVCVLALCRLRYCRHATTVAADDGDDGAHWLPSARVGPMNISATCLNCPPTVLQSIDVQRSFILTHLHTRCTDDLLSLGKIVNISVSIKIMCIIMAIRVLSPS